MMIIVIYCSFSEIKPSSSPIYLQYWLCMIQITGLRTEMCHDGEGEWCERNQDVDAILDFCVPFLSACLRREHQTDGGQDFLALSSEQVTGQATEMHNLRMQLLAELQRQHSSTAGALAAVEECARKMLAAAKRVAGEDQRRHTTAAHHQQIVKVAKEAGQISSLDKPYFDAIGRILVSGPRGSHAAQSGSARGRWGDGNVSDAALEAMLEANCAIMASVLSVSVCECH